MEINALYVVPRRIGKGELGNMAQLQGRPAFFAPSSCSGLQSYRKSACCSTQILRAVRATESRADRELSIHGTCAGHVQRWSQPLLRLEPTGWSDFDLW